MNPKFARSLILASSLIAHSAAADEDEFRAGFEVGARTGYAVALGRLAKDSADLSEVVAATIPVQLDIGFRVTPAVSLGGYLQYGFGIRGETFSNMCQGMGISPSAEMDCQVHNVRLGLQGLVHLRPGEKLDPWLGIGVGHEWLSYSAEGVSGMYATKIKFRFSGMEFLQLQGGLDAHVNEAFSLGPFVSFSIGQYGSGAVHCTGDCFANPSYDDELQRAMHHWLLLGAKGSLLL